MSQAFSLSPSQCAVPTAPALREEIMRYTGDEAATNGIIRSLERFGTDSTIERYEVACQQRGRYAPKGSSASWTVRAVRFGEPPRPPLGTVIPEDPQAEGGHQGRDSRGPRRSF